MASRDEWRQAAETLQVDGNRMAGAGALLAEALDAVGRLEQDARIVLRMLGWPDDAHPEALVHAVKEWLERRAEIEVVAQNALEEEKEARRVAEANREFLERTTRQMAAGLDRAYAVSRRRKTTLPELKQAIADAMPKM